MQPRTPGKRTRETWRLRPGALTSLSPRPTPAPFSRPPPGLPSPLATAHLPPSSPRWTSGAGEVLHSSPWAERGAESPPPSPAFSCPDLRRHLVSRLPGGGEHGSGGSGVWRCCQPRGERLDNYSPRGGGRRQGLSTWTAFGGSPQLGERDPFRVFFLRGGVRAPC